MIHACGGEGSYANKNICYAGFYTGNHREKHSSGNGAYRDLASLLWQT
jgi:hypothetical protein